MKQNKYITVNEFLQLPLSDAIEQVIFDIQTEFKNTPLDMNTWWKSTKNGKICSVCLGGAAVLSFDKNLLTINPNVECIGDYDKKYAKIAKTFNEVRLGDILRAARTWYGDKLRGEKHLKVDDLFLKKSYPYITGVLKSRVLLIKVLTKMANDLRKIGL